MPVSPRQPGTKSEDEPTQNILAMNISGGAASVSINFTNGDPLPVGGFYSDASIVELDGPHGSDPLVTTATAAMIGNDVIRYSANTTLTDNLTSDGGILAISGTTNLNNEAGDSLIVAPGATVYVNGSQTFSSLTIDAGATVRQISQNTTFGASVITVGSLEIQDPDNNGNGGGVLDLGYGDLIDQPGISPDVSGYTGESETDQIEQWLAAGYDGGAWDGEIATGPNPAAIVSSGAANNPYLIESLGYAEVGTDTTDGNLEISTFDGQAVSAGDTVVGLTYYGDANLDRQVNSTDISLISSVATGWTSGDFNYSGNVDGDMDQLLIGNVVTILLEGVTTQPSTQPTAPPWPGANGNISGGTQVGSPAQVNSNTCTGTVTITVGTSANTSPTETHPDSIAFTFNRSNGSAWVHCHWVQIIIRTGTKADGTAMTGTYPVKLKNTKTNGFIDLNRTWGQSYFDPGSQLGWVGNVRPAENVEIGFDGPNDPTLTDRGGSATTTWTAEDYLVCDGVVVYEVSWKMTQTAATYPARTYTVTGQGAATQIQGNPQKISVGDTTDADGKVTAVNLTNPAYVPPAK